jgi:uncharacterized alpha-E superfamily protein
MISRVAEHCFWMSRYLERAENTARVLEVNQTMLLDCDVPLEQQWKPLLVISGIHDYTGPLDAETVQQHMSWETANACSIASSLAAARENARIIREVISEEMWERINYYYLWMQSPGTRVLFDHHRHEFYNQIKRINQLLCGIAEGTMAHGEAFDFFRLGRYLERACQTARVLDVKYHLVRNNPQIEGSPFEGAHWTAILKSCSAYEPFHKQHHSLERGVALTVADFLILDPIFPRSVRFCVKQCQLAAHAISRSPLHRVTNDTEQSLLALLDWLNLATIDDMVRSDLHEWLTLIVDRIHEVGDSVYRCFFDFHTPRALVQSQG